MTKIEWQEKFRDNLSRLMKDRKLSQYELARISGLSPSRISEYINMKVMPSTYAVINMAYSLDVSISDLIDFGERIR